MPFCRAASRLADESRCLVRAERRHRHAVQQVSEAEVSAQQEGFAGAIRALVQWKEKPDHVFSACDDGTVKVGRRAAALNRIRLRVVRGVADLLEIVFGLFRTIMAFQ